MGTKNESTRITMKRHVLYSNLANSDTVRSENVASLTSHYEKRRLFTELSIIRAEPPRSYQGVKHRVLGHPCS